MNLKKYVLFIILCVGLFAIPVMAKDDLIVKNINLVEASEGVAVNSETEIDTTFNDLEQNVRYEVVLKNNSDKLMTLDDFGVSNSSYDYVEYSISEESKKTTISPNSEKKVYFSIKTNLVEKAGKNFDDKVQLKFVFREDVVNPATGSSIIGLVAVLIVLGGTAFIIKNNLGNKVKIVSIIVLFLSIGIVDVVADSGIEIIVDGNVSYKSQNILETTGSVIKSGSADYSNAKDVWAYHDQVKNISISSLIKEPEKYEKKFDLSVDDKNKVYAYLVDSGDEDVPYDLYIMSNGIIYANEDSSLLFSFPNVEEVNGLDNIDFSNTTSMKGMFIGDKKLEEVDVESLVMDNVDDTSYMFYKCDNVKHTEDDFKLDNVSNKEYMFGSIYAVSFEEDDWRTIVAAVKSGNYPYKVGDTRKIDMGEFGTHTLRVANTSTPSECSQEGFSQTACGFVLEFTDIISTHAMYSMWTDVGGGWPASELRTYVNDDIYNALPTELKGVIIDTIVVSGHGKSASLNFTSTDKLYLLSTAEVWLGGLSTDTASSSTRQLDYYNELNLTLSNYSGAIKQYNGSNFYWWLRAATSWGSDFYLVSIPGDSCVDGAAYAGGVSPAFRIG